MSTHLPRSAFALAALALLAACADNPAAPEPPAPELGDARAAFECRADVKSRSVECTPARPAGGARAAIILGGQGTYVRIATANVQYLEGDEYFSADFTVQNLLDQPLGTDGTTVGGVTVFFASGPVATGGTGTVTILNEDGTGTFTGPGQPYFEYPGVIEPRGISPAKPWEFNVPSSVESFAFTLYVRTQLPAEPSVLKWKLENGTPVFLGTLWGMWAAAPHNVFAVSDFGAVLHYDGNYWRGLSTGVEETLYAVWGSAANDVWAVGELGVILHWDGSGWTPQEDPDLGPDDFYGVWGSCACDVWAVGGFGRISHWDGSDWTDFTDENLTTDDLYAVWGAASDDVWAVGMSGTILHWDGAAWSQVGSPTTAALFGVRGTSSGDVWAVGCDCETGDPVALHWNGTEWTADTDPDVLAAGGLNAVWAASPTDVWAVGNDAVLHNDGTGWEVAQSGEEVPYLSVYGTGSGNVLMGGLGGFIQRWNGAALVEMAAPQPTLYASWVAPDGQAWAVGESGTALHRDGGGWTPELFAAGPELRGVWGASSAAVWAVGVTGEILFRNGAGEWGPQASGTTEDLNGVWGAGASDVLAVGTAGTILRFDGSDWGPMASGSVADLAAVWGTSASDAFAVGTGGTILRWNGAAWAPMVSGTTEDLLGVWGSGPTDVYAVGNAGTVLHYDGNPLGTWEPVSIPALGGGDVHAVWGSGAADVFLLADDGYHIVRYDGAEWRVMSSYSVEANIQFYGLAGNGSRNLYAVGDLGAILHGER